AAGSPSERRASVAARARSDFGGGAEPGALLRLGRELGGCARSLLAVPTLQIGWAGRGRARPGGGFLLALLAGPVAPRLAGASCRVRNRADWRPARVRPGSTGGPAFHGRARFFQRGPK